MAVSALRHAAHRRHDSGGDGSTGPPADASVRTGTRRRSASTARSSSSSPRSRAIGVAGLVAAVNRSSGPDAAGPGSTEEEAALTDVATRRDRRGDDERSPDANPRARSCNAHTPASTRNNPCRRPGGDARRSPGSDRPASPTSCSPAASGRRSDRPPAAAPGPGDTRPRSCGPGRPPNGAAPSPSAATAQESDPSAPSPEVYALRKSGHGCVGIAETLSRSTKRNA